MFDLVAACSVSALSRTIGSGCRSGGFALFELLRRTGVAVIPLLPPHATTHAYEPSHTHLQTWKASPSSTPPPGFPTSWPAPRRPPLPGAPPAASEPGENKKIGTKTKKAGGAPVLGAFEIVPVDRYVRA